MPRRRISLSDFMLRCNKLHLNKYSYTKVDLTSKKVVITCPDHGEVEQDWGNHMRGSVPMCCRVSKIKLTKTAKLADDPKYLVNQKIKAMETSLLRYGVVWGAQSPQAKCKRKKTNIERYGCDNTFQSQPALDNLKKYHDSSTAIQTANKKRVLSNLSKYGVEYPIQNGEVCQKMVDNTDYHARSKTQKATIRHRYGVDFISQVPEIHQKQLDGQKKSHKRFTFPESKKSVNLQGFEPEVIMQLLSEGICEDDIQLNNRPAIKYFWSSVDGYGDDKWHYYHPDIIITSQHKIVEVKSGWTFDGNGTNQQLKSRNLAKRQGCIESGWEFEFRIFN